MPRVGDVFQLLSGTLAVPNTTIQSAPYNAQQNDWVLEANAPRPISAGGTGSTTASGARASLGAIGAADLAASPTKAAVVNTDSVVIIDSQAANATKRWLVSDMRTAFGPTNHNHERLVSTAADISFIIGGTPGAGWFYFMKDTIGSTAGASISEAGDMYLATVAATGAITAATITAATTITAGGTVGVKGSGSGNVHFWFYGPGGEDRGVIFTSGGAAGNIYVRTASQSNFTFNDAGGSFHANGNIYSGSAYLRTDGNVYGSIWGTWAGTPGVVASANAAISARIEERASAHANDRVKATAGRKVTGGNSGTSANWSAPVGAVVTGYVRDSGNSGQVQYLTYHYLQIFNAVDGWVGFTG